MHYCDLWEVLGNLSNIACVFMCMIVFVWMGEKEKNTYIEEYIINR